MNRPQFVENEIYHIYNRGVEKRKIFMNNKDYLRFAHGMFEFNNEHQVANTLYHLKNNTKNIEVEPRYELVEILAFVLMPNHFHFILKQKSADGISKFMQKLGTGYTMYFNKKYERVGSLFQGRFKAVLIGREAQYIHIPSYIHLNPLELIPYRGSTSIGIQDKLDFLENYRWSSYLDYIGKRNFPHLISKELYLGFFGGEKGYQEEIKRLLKEEKEFPIEVEPR